MTSDFKETLWNAADKFRRNIDAADYKHIVLGLIFLKHISDRFTRQQVSGWEMVAEPGPDSSARENAAVREEQIDERSRRTKDSAFWIPPEARWEALRSKSRQPDIGIQIDAALAAIENANPSLCGKLNKCFGDAPRADHVLRELIDLLSTAEASDNGGTTQFLCEVYEYFLDRFADADGRRGGDFYTPPHVAKTLITILSPASGRIYDPCCGTGGMLVQSEKFVTSRGGQASDISLYGQELVPAIRQLAAMNLITHGVDADLGKEAADIFDPDQDQFPDLKFDCIAAHPPLRLPNWNKQKHNDDPRWKFGHPSPHSASYAWLQHVLWKLRQGGQAGVVLDNSSLSFSPRGDLQIRKAMVDGDAVEMLITLPGGVLLNSEIPVCLWFLTNDKTANGRDRRGETLFIDARELGRRQTRFLRVLDDEDIAKISRAVRAWKTGGSYQDIKGFCKSATLDEIKKHDYLIHPGRFVGLSSEKDDSEPFHEKARRLTAEWDELQDTGKELDDQITRNLKLLEARDD